MFEKVPLILARMTLEKLTLARTILEKLILVRMILEKLILARMILEKIGHQFDGVVDVEAFSFVQCVEFHLCVVSIVVVSWQ